MHACECSQAKPRTCSLLGDDLCENGCRGGTHLQASTWIADYGRGPIKKSECGVVGESKLKLSHDRNIIIFNDVASCFTLTWGEDPERVVFPTNMVLHLRNKLGGSWFRWFS